MATQLLSIGYPQTILQNVVYAVPSSKCLLTADAGLLSFDQSLDGVNFVGLTFTNNQVEVGGAFIRNTGTNVDVGLKKL